MFDRLLTPVELGPVTAANRIARSPHGTGLGQREIGDDLVAYTLSAASDGIGLIVLEDAAVHRSSPPAAGLLAWDDSVIAGYEKIVRAVEHTGVVLFQQLFHSGGYRPRADGGAPWAPSAIPYIGYPGLPLEMTQAMIDEMVEAYAAGTRRARQGGLRGVELHAAHGYLVAQFLSPLTNRRTDGYGGPFENRIRFAREALTAMREAAGPDMAIGIRMSSDEAAEGGLTVGDTTQIALALEDLVDVVNLSFGNRFSHERMIAAMQEPHGYQLPSAEPIAKALGVPVIAGGRVTSLVEAERALEEGQADIVSMVRATIADPELIRKTLAGRASEVRPCIGCNHGCVAGIFRPVPRIGCAVNPGAGFELTIGDRHLGQAAAARRVVVVGGGPAGLEAARVAALRGHDVVLVEARDRLGGQLDLARRAPLRGEIGAWSDWAARELDRLGVDVRTGRAADAAAVLAERPDAVVVATGSVPDGDGVQAAAPDVPVEVAPGAAVRTSWDVLGDGPDGLGETVLVLDDVGHYEAIAVVDALHAGGHRVVLVTPHPTVGTLVETSLSATPARARFEQAGLRLLAHARLMAVAPGAARVRSLLTGREETVAADAAVLVCRSLPQHALAGALAGQVADVRVVGDADSPRFLQAAIRDAHLAAREL